MKETEIDGRKGAIPCQIDAVGLFCPVPIVKLKMALEKLKPKEIVEIVADDPGFPEDIVAWCQETQNHLLSLKQGEGNTFIAQVEKS